MREEQCRQLADEAASAFAADLDLSFTRRSKGAHRGSTCLRADQAPAWTQLSTVYTAFDGDHFAAVPLMRRHVLSRGRVPLNPESVVGYKDSVDAHHTKFGVLKADIAVVARSRSIWIYADEPPTPAAIAHLAEGVLLELLWYLRMCGANELSPDVRTVDLKAVIAGNDPIPQRLALTFDEVASALRPGQRELLDRVADLDRWGLPRLVFCAYDPLDSKYADWVRAHAHNLGEVALLPTLAIELGDAPLDRVAAAWLTLLAVSDHVWIFESIEVRPSSCWVQHCMLLADACGVSSSSMKWNEVGAPKAVHGRSWALSADERDATTLGTEVERGSV